MVCVVAIAFGWAGAVMRDIVVKQINSGCALQITVVRHGPQHTGLAALVALVRRGQMVGAVKTAKNMAPACRCAFDRCGDIYRRSAQRGRAKHE